jgi:signal transduction histidine kinase
MTARLDGTIDFLVWFSILCIVISGILVYIWWKTGITKTYKDSQVEKENEELCLKLAKKDERIAEVEKDNAELSRIIHSDNKLIPTLKNAVSELIENYSEQKAAEVLKEINRVFALRKGTINRYKKESKKLPTTRIASLDMTLEYMKQKAYENDIEFDVLVSGNIKFMTENLIGEERLRVMAADLLENAIIAVKSCQLKNILFTIGICDDAYEMRVEDSGVDFGEETLRELGKKQITTHKDEGGSGIGMMEVFDTMRETGASLRITRLPEGGRGFTKRVSVRFDGKGEFQTYAFR